MRMLWRCTWLMACVAMSLGLLTTLAETPREKAGPTDKKEPKNLIPNGDFEKGTDSPDGWQKIDGLTTFWEKDPDGKRGKVIRIDTDVLQSQAYEWWVKISKG